MRIVNLTIVSETIKYLCLQLGVDYCLPVLERQEVCNRWLDSRQADLGLRAGGSGDLLGLQDYPLSICLFQNSW